MQSKLVAIVLCVSVATTLWTSLVNCTDEEIPEYYLPVPSESITSRRLTYEMLIKDTRPAGLEPQKMLEEFDQIETSTGYDREFYKEMRNLADPDNRSCNWSLRNNIFNIMTLAKEHPDVPVFANYMNYVKTYGKAKFTKCFEKMKRKFDKIDLSASFENGFNEFVARYSGLKRFPTDEELYNKARGMCLSSENLEVEKTLEVAKKYEHDKDATPSEVVQTFIGHLCKQFEKTDLKYALQIVNLGVALGAEIPSDLPVEYLKLIEYNRICVAWNKGDKTRPGMVEVTGNAPADTQENDKKWYKLF